VKAFTSAGNVLGLSPIAYARQAIGLGMAAERFAARFFGDSAIPTGIITTDQQIHHDEARALKERWAVTFGGERSAPWSTLHGRGVAVLGGGARFQAITIPPEESQFLETSRANIATVARYFRVQPELIGGESGGSLTYANVEQRALDFLQFGLAPWLVRMETAISGLLSSTTTVKFNAGALVRTDLLTRYQPTRAPSAPAGNAAPRCGSSKTSHPSPASTTPNHPRQGLSHDPRPQLHQLPGRPRRRRRPHPPRPRPPLGRRGTGG
jgi:HK97 family phage portal protein